MPADIWIAANLGGTSSDYCIGDRGTVSYSIKDNEGVFGSKCQRIENLCFGWKDIQVGRLIYQEAFTFRQTFPLTLRGIFQEVFW